MSKSNAIKLYIENIFKNSRFAVLATEGEGQPHASFIAITPMEGYRKLIFATYRDTRKYSNLVLNPRVAMLIESGTGRGPEQQDSFVLTAFGQLEEIRAEEYDAVFMAHLNWHPDLYSFMHSEDCSLVQIKVNTYQVVRGIDDVEWWSIGDLVSPDSE